MIVERIDQPFVRPMDQLLVNHRLAGEVVVVLENERVDLRVDICDSVRLVVQRRLFDDGADPFQVLHMAHPMSGVYHCWSAAVNPPCGVCDQKILIINQSQR